MRLKNFWALLLDTFFGVRGEDKKYVKRNRELLKETFCIETKK